MIYCYADILGYKNLLRTFSAAEVHEILSCCFSEMYSLLKQYMTTPVIREKYRFGIEEYEDFPYFELQFAGKFDKIIEYNKKVRNQIDPFILKTYIAFDTIVIYWEQFEYTSEHIEVFLLAIDLVYLLLYQKGILIRGAIGSCDDYYISEETQDKIFVIKNIDIAFAIEKMQNWANLMLFGQEVFDLFRGLGKLSDDFFARKDYYKIDPNDPMSKKALSAVPIKDENILDSIRPLVFEDRDTFLVCCPVNNVCLDFFGEDFFRQLYHKVKTIQDKGVTEKSSDVELKQFYTACFLEGQIRSCAFTEQLTEKGTDKWQRIISEPTKYL